MYVHYRRENAFTLYQHKDPGDTWKPQDTERNDRRENEFTLYQHKDPGDTWKPRDTERNVFRYFSFLFSPSFGLEEFLGLSTTTIPNTSADLQTVKCVVFFVLTNVGIF